MNTIRSVGYGWGVLILAGGGAYYFAKQSINKDREQRAAADEARRRRTEQLRDLEHGIKSGHPPSDLTLNPSHEASADPAPTRHAPETARQQTEEKSKYEASEPFRSRKGNRLSS